MSNENPKATIYLSGIIEPIEREVSRELYMYVEDRLLGYIGWGQNSDGKIKEFGRQIGKTMKTEGKTNAYEIIHNHPNFAAVKEASGSRTQEVRLEQRLIEEFEFGIKEALA